MLPDLIAPTGEKLAPLNSVRVPVVLGLRDGMPASFFTTLEDLYRFAGPRIAKAFDGIDLPDTFAPLADPGLENAGDLADADVRVTFEEFGTDLEIERPADSETVAVASPDDERLNSPNPCTATPGTDA